MRLHSCWVSVSSLDLGSELTGLALCLGRDETLLQAPVLSPYLITIPLLVLINKIFLALIYWNSRTKRLSCLSVAWIISALASTETPLGAGIAGFATRGASSEKAG